jgi:lysophospholipase L1-like esterase
MSQAPLVFIIGDSISMGYTPHVARELEGRARVERHEGNGGDSHNVLSNLKSMWLPALGEKPDLIHVNCGLHDLRFWVEKGEYQVPLESYAKNLALLAKALGATGAKIVWCATTPVLDGAPNMSKQFPRKNSDVDAYNAAAAEAMGGAGFAVDDLNAFVKQLGPEKVITPDGVHFTEEGYAQLGAEVARVAAESLGL